MTSPSEKTRRPRDVLYDWALDRITVLQDFARRNCKEPTCGVRDEDGEFTHCLSKDCGEKRLDEHHANELAAMRVARSLVEWLETSEIEKKAADDKPGRKR